MKYVRHDQVDDTFNFEGVEDSSLVGKRLDRVFEQNVPKSQQQAYLDRTEGWRCCGCG